VVVEPTRRFSRSLQPEVNSENVYGGTIGIYWPDGSGRRSFFVGHEYDGAIDIKRAIIEEVRTALMNRRPMFRCTWSAVQEAVSKAAYASLRASGSNEVKEYIQLFDSEIKARNQELSEAEREIDRLNNEIKRLETLAAVGTVTIRTGPERDMYDGELREIVRDALQDAVTHVQADSRREHVLKAILQVTPKWEATKTMRETLKDILRGYKTMGSATRKGLENMGFTIEEQGKHYKLIFHDDDRYTFSLAKSGSDHRGGLNASTDISKRLF
jgi:hypothetical protein